MNVPPLRHLRRKPGRPRNVESSKAVGPAPNGEGNSTVPETRLLDLMQTAHYLGVSSWTVRDLEAQGVLARVCVPLPGGRELRKLLFDKAELDRLIETWKEAAVPRV
jgi:hypothetical protein